jgi:hypothetical protein
VSFNGSGTFVINSTGQPVVANTVISATVFNALTADLASGLTNCITKDGQSTPTANIPMGSNKITGLANGTLIGDAANLGQVQSTVAKLISITGTDTVLGTMSPTLTAYAAGQLFYFIASGANTGAVTLNIDGLGAKAITRDGSTALAAGDINSGEIVVVIYDGTRFQMINAANSFGNTTINGTLTVTGNTGLQANVSVTSALSVGGTFAVTGAATLGSTLAVTGKSNLPTVSTASANAAVAVITDLRVAGASITSANVGTAVVTTGTVTNLTATSASVASVNAGVALLTTATVTNLTATGASIASANAGVANITDLRAVGASVTSANLGTAVVTNGTVTNLTATSASVASVNAAVALLTTATVTTLTATGASIASANIGNLQFTAASIASINAGVAVINNLTATSASIASMNGSVANITTVNATTVDATNVEVTNVKAKDGTAAITIADSTGNVGIGTVGPTAKLDVVNSINLGLNYLNIGYDAGGGAGWVSGYNTTYSGGVKNVTTGALSGVFYSSDSIRFHTNTSAAGGTSAPERMRIDSSGNVGIGTASPTVPLEIGKTIDNNQIRLKASNGNVDLRINSGFASSDVAAMGVVGGYPLTFFTNNTERMRIDSSGNVGIGTGSANKSSSSTALTVNTGTAGNYSAVEWASGDTLNYHINANNSAIYHVAAGTRPWIVYTNGSERMRIDSSGNVGIGGTADASDKVCVKGTLPVSSNTSAAFINRATASSSNTGVSYGFASLASTEAASFTLGSITGYGAFQGTFGAGSTVTNQYGFLTAGLTGATNNYGFYSDIASGFNRWNFYAAGTAQNYFAGNTGFGTTAVTNARLNYVGTFSASTIGSFPSLLGAGGFGGGIGFLDTNVAGIYTQDSGASLLFFTGQSASDTAGDKVKMRVTATGVIAGTSAALATTATNGFLYIPTCAGTPTGTPTAVTGMAPIIVDTTNNKLYFYSTGQWRDAGP